MTLVRNPRARRAGEGGLAVVGLEPVTAACLAASLAAGRPTREPTPGTTMAGLDCAEVSPAVWPSLAAGIHATTTVDDAASGDAMRELSAAGFEIGESGAAALAGLRALVADPGAAGLLGPQRRVLLVATEGRTGG